MLGDVSTLDRIADEVVACRACPRLVAWREQVAREKRRARSPTRRTGADRSRVSATPEQRVADRRARAGGARRQPHRADLHRRSQSGDFLFAALHRAGLANQPTSVARDDGLALRARMSPPVNRCAPPANRPTPEERDACLPFLVRELEAAAAAARRSWRSVRSRGTASCARSTGRTAAPAPRPRFGHGARGRGRPVRADRPFHPSQQNTFTGKLTPDMLDAVLRRASERAVGLAVGPKGSLRLGRVVCFDRMSRHMRVLTRRRPTDVPSKPDRVARPSEARRRHLPALPRQGRDRRARSS